MVWRMVGGDEPVEDGCAAVADGALDVGGATTGLGEECVGWVAERDFAFGTQDVEIARVVRLIVRENLRVRDQDRVPYVRVAVFQPMTPVDGGAMGAREILNALQGAYAAQYEANHDGLRDRNPLVQLVLANEGADHSQAKPVIDKLATLMGGPHPLVAVTGMSISVPATQQAGVWLSEKGLPAVGAVLTADDMVAPGLFKVSPSNKQYAKALRSYLKGLPEAVAARTRSGYLVWDRSPDDRYVKALKQALVGEFGADYQLNDRNRAFTGSKPPTEGTPQLFADIVDDICAVNPDLVFYAGRDRDMSALVAALKARGRCRAQPKPVVIVTGATGLTATAATLDAAKVGIVDAASTDSAGWARNVPGTPVAFREFRELFTGAEPDGLGFSDADLLSGYAVMHRDAVVAAVWATRLAAAARIEADPQAGPPSAVDVRNALFSSSSMKIPGASGAMYFREDPPNDLWPIAKPVPIVRLGAAVRDWPADAVWTTTPVNAG